MKLAFLADCHIGNPARFPGTVTASVNERCRETLAALTQGLRLAGSTCDHVFIAGDLFDKSEPIPQIVTATMRAIRDNILPEKLTILAGNHDIHSDSPGDFALGPIGHVANIIETPTRRAYDYSHPSRGAEVLCYPYQHGSTFEGLKTFLAATPPSTRKHRILVFHAGIADSTTPPYLLGEQSIHVDQLFQLLERYGIDAAFAGDWHARKAWRRDGLFIGQIGALCPTGWDNPGLHDYGCLVTWDSEAADPACWHDVPGPRFLNFSGIEELEKFKLISDMHATNIYARLTVKPADHAAATAALQSAKDRGHVYAGEVVLDSTDRKAAAREAGEAAAKVGQSLSEMIDAYIAKMDLPPDVPKAEVATAAKGYVAR